jgi:hypothetical protein
VYCAFASGAAIANSVNASVVEISDFDVLKAFPPSIAVVPKIRATPFGAEHTTATPAVCQRIVKR